MTEEAFDSTRKRISWSELDQAHDACVELVGEDQQTKIRQENLNGTIGYLRGNDQTCAKAYQDAARFALDVQFSFFKKEINESVYNSRLTDELNSLAKTADQNCIALVGKNRQIQLKNQFFTNY